VVGGKANFCPVCNLLLGPNPWEHNKLKYDFMLDSIVRKVCAARGAYVPVRWPGVSGLGAGRTAPRISRRRGLRWLHAQGAACRLARAAQVFPRPKLDEALEARRLEREEATRQAKASLRRSRQAFAGSAAQLAAAGAGRLSGAGRDGVHVRCPVMRTTANTQPRTPQAVNCFQRLWRVRQHTHRR
jgi:hypothetical protein